MNKKHYPAIFISDWHMGAKTFNAPLLLDFLRHNECDSLYLVGDIIDGWKLKKRWYWPDIYTEVLNEILAMKESGTNIIYVAGNHDELLRRLKFQSKRKLKNTKTFHVVDEIIHRTKDGKKYIVTHGDQFDRKILQGRLSKMSDRLHAWIYEKINKDGPYIQIKGKQKRFSLAKAVNATGKRALNLLCNFERIACKYAARHLSDGIICGHTHVPSLQKINGIVYANSGGWLRDIHTAVVETPSGEIELISWEGVDVGAPSANKQISLNTYKLVSLIHEIWRPEKTENLNQTIRTLLDSYTGALSRSRTYRKILAS